MRLCKVRIKGVTCFNGGREFDFTEPGLIAIVGRNGSGKSTLMEAAPASTWKTLPTRPGSLYDYCHGKDAYIETEWCVTEQRDPLGDGPAMLIVRLLIDADNRRTEGYVTADNQPLCTGKAGNFKAVIEQYFGSRELFLSSVFATQDKSGNFLAMKKGERKALFAELLGLGALEAMAQGARGKASQCEGVTRVNRAILAEIRKDAEQLPALEASFAAAEQRLVAAEEMKAHADSRLLAMAKNVDASEAAAEASVAASTACTIASSALHNARAVVKSAELEIDRVKKYHDERMVEIYKRRVDQLVPLADAQHERAVAALDERRDRIKKLIEDAPDYLSASKVKEGAQESLRKIAEQTNERVRRMHRKSAVEAELTSARLGGKLLRDVPCTDEKMFDMSPEVPKACPLLREAHNADRLVEPLETELNELTSWLDGDDDGAREVRANDAQDIIVACINNMAQAEAAGKSVSELTAIEGELLEADKILERMHVEAGERVAQAESDSKDTLARYKDEFHDAGLALVAASESEAKAKTDLTKAQKTLGDAQATADQLELRVKQADEARSMQEDANTEFRSADNDLTRLGTELRQLKTKTARAGELDRGLADTDRDLGDWNLLSSSLGQDGLQAMLIDAAAPEVTELANELLQSCWGSRFSITMETLREKKTKTDEFMEVFDVNVYDGGHHRSVEALSGGERVIVSEAVSLALAVFNSRKNSIRYRTLWRDETAGALDPENAQAYVAMLRRAIELGAYHNCIFVAHLPEVFEQADVQVKL